MAALWDGTAAGIVQLRFLWALTGALTVALLHAALRRAFGAGVAAAAGLWAAASTGLLVLSSSINNETPYLLLAIGSFFVLPEVVDRPRLGAVAAWGILQAVACLFRVEHALFVILATSWLVARWARAAALRPALAAVLLAALVLPLVPWHVQAWSALAQFNEEEPRLDAAAEASLRAVEGGHGRLEWEAAAAARRDRLPAFVRRTAAAFVAATVRHRGGDRVRAADLDAVTEAFDDEPRPLSSRPFVALYGPLNFALANHAGATGGFSTALLEVAPSVASPDRFPAALLQGLPPPQLAFTYPPHLKLVNDGYSVGAAWIGEHPLDAVRLAGRKLWIFWSGAALGVTGWGAPVGLSGLRRAVDLAVPQGLWATTWQVAVLALCVYGFAAARQAALTPWILFLFSKVAVTVLFFGYARMGATCAPVVALLLALGGGRLVDRLPDTVPRRRTAVAATLSILLLGAEAARWISRPSLSVDGRSVVGGDPFPADLHRDQEVWVE